MLVSFEKRAGPSSWMQWAIYLAPATHLGRCVGIFAAHKGLTAREPPFQALAESPGRMLTQDNSAESAGDIHHTRPTFALPSDARLARDARTEACPIANAHPLQGSVETRNGPRQALRPLASRSSKPMTLLAWPPCGRATSLQTVSSSSLLVGADGAYQSSRAPEPWDGADGASCAEDSLSWAGAASLACHVHHLRLLRPKSLCSTGSATLSEEARGSCSSAGGSFGS
jgi:hypothetical protein